MFHLASFQIQKTDESLSFFGHVERTNRIRDLVNVLSAMVWKQSNEQACGANIQTNIHSTIARSQSMDVELASPHYISYSVLVKAPKAPCSTDS